MNWSRNSSATVNKCITAKLKSDDDTRTRILMLLFAIIAVDREVCQAETDLIWDLFTP